MNFTKLLIKVVNEQTENVEWTHISYISPDIYNRYMKENNLTSADLNDVISRWCYEDFRVKLPMSTNKDIAVLKSLIKDFYKRAHPELYIESPTDRQGWIRIWLTKKMKEDLKIYGEERF